MHRTRLLLLAANAAALRPGGARRAVARAAAAPDAAPDAAARVLFCLGGPGAGKGTQCARLEAEFGWAHVSAGELLRAARAAGDSEESRVIAECLDRGAIVPVAVTLRLLRRAIDAAARGGAPVVVVDGFPRNADNVKGWEADAATRNLDLRGVLFYDVPEAVLLRRIAARGASGDRADDDAETAARRIRVYEEATRPIVDLYERRGALLSVRGEGEVDEVWRLTKEALAPLLGAE